MVCRPGGTILGGAGPEPPGCRAGGQARGHGPPLAGGLVGWLGYEAGTACERMPPPLAPRRLPDVALWRVEGAIVQDRTTGRCAAHGSPRFVRQARAVARRAAALPPPAVYHPLLRPPDPPPGTGEAYRTAVRRALDEIARGNVYQVNLAWALRRPATLDPVGAWLALRAANPARHGALLGAPEGWILGNSPECYLAVQVGGHGTRALSLPIKGTAAREGGAGARRYLWESDKERAELTMIVDLVRNDLGRVARPGGVVAGMRRLRTCGDLWHAEQAVIAKLRPRVDALDAIAASFPPGSVTGAPKVAAMALIGELEGGPRGVYTGAVAALGDDGRAWLSVAIRTATLVDGQAEVHIGAGIVADSDPEAEWRETLAKGRTLARYAMLDPQGYP